MYACFDCDARIGCHSDSWVSLGTLANAELRSVRSKAHKSFDFTWKECHMSRTDAYQWLAEQLNLDKDECHIGLFDIDKCNQVIEISMNFAYKDLKLPWDEIRRTF